MNPLDHFVLTRVMGAPELIFNQSVYNERFFDEADQQTEWRLSSSCYITEKHKVVAILFDRSRAQQDGYKLIDDKDICKLLKKLIKVPKRSKK